MRLQISAFRSSGSAPADVRVVWGSSVATYKELSVQLLVSTDRALERWYPDSSALIKPLRWGMYRRRS